MAVVACCTFVPVLAQDHNMPDDLRLRLWALRDTAQQNTLASSEHLHNPTEVQQFYEQRGYRPAWLLGLHVSTAAKQFANCLNNAYKNGLLPDDYHYTALQQLMAQSEGGAAAGVPTVNFLDIDILLSDAFLLLSRHYAQGKVDPESIGMAWHISKKMFNPISFFNQTLESELPPCRALDQLLPTDNDYKALQQALADYETKSDWAAIKYSWNTLFQRGDADPTIAQIRNILTITGDLNAIQTASSSSNTASWSSYSSDPMIFDRALEQAVMRFQRRHGLYYDGVVRNTTITHLNVSRQERIAQLKANLERHRWMPKINSDSYVVVNIPEFELRVFDEGQLKYQEAVIVGRENYPTPSFADSLQYIAFNPFWYMPKSIARNELIPQIQLDPNYFINNAVKVFKDGKLIDAKKVNWKTANSDDYTFAQAASAYNPMGVVKFMFPNPHDIYIHDTPSRELFDNNRRSFSHGCVRVKDPVKFAAFLLEGDAAWDSTRIQKVLFSQKETRVNLPKPIPIYLEYRTIFWDDTAKELNLREDLYKWDAKLTQALELPLP